MPGQEPMPRQAAGRAPAARQGLPADTRDPGLRAAALGSRLEGGFAALERIQDGAHVTLIHLDEEDQVTSFTLLAAEDDSADENGDDQ